MRRLNTLAFLIVIFAGMLWLGLRLMQDWPALQRQLASATWYDGAITAALDQRFAAAVPSDTVVDHALNGVLYATTADTGPQVRSGCPGWLFLSEETGYVANAERHLQQRLQLTQLLIAEFKQRDILLLAVPVPDKAEMASAQLCGVRVAQQAAQRRHTWKQASAGLALTQVDLAGGWRKPGYWRTDSHWNRPGASAAASRVAHAIQALLPAPAASTIRLHVRDSAHVRPGDLAHLAGLGNNPSPFGPLPDLDQDIVLEIARSGGLLDDAVAPQIMLAGSSYSTNTGFIDYLQTALQQEVAQQSMAGSGFAGSLLNLLQQHPARLQDIRLLIWEWPLRALYQPLSAEETAYLSAHSSSVSPFTSPLISPSTGASQ